MAELVSIIVPCRTIDDYTKKCVRTCTDVLDYPDIEIIILTDSPEQYAHPKVRVISTGPVVPGTKRNIGMKAANGKYIAFLDSDAYPRKDWLTNAVRYLQDKDVIGVGGPGVTPPEDGPLQVAGGMVYESPLMGGLKKRYSQGTLTESIDIHSCNMIVKKDALEGVSWSEHYWPGEDTLFCRDLLSKNRGKLLEAGDVLIYHHRRKLFRSHMRQVMAFGLHRGYFAKRFPENSRKLIYFLPSIAFLFTVAIIISAVFIPIIWLLVGVVLLGYSDRGCHPC